VNLVCGDFELTKLKKGFVDVLNYCFFLIIVVNVYADRDLQEMNFNFPQFVNMFILIIYL